jgi:CRISPR-associated protein Cas1
MSAEQIPLDAVHQYAFCPRRSYLMYHDGQWESNFYTDDGLLVHARIDASDDPLPEPKEDNDDPPTISRSVQLGSIVLGITAKLDIVEAEGNMATPVEAKRSKVPQTNERSWPSQRIQVMAQGLLLREAGFESTGGILYFFSSRCRVPVPFTSELEATTKQVIQETHAILNRPVAPPPLIDSPKCIGCSLSGICMPDETSLLSLDDATADTSAALPVRRLFPARDDALPVYIQEQGAWVGKSGDGLTIKKGGKPIARLRLIDISQLVICGNVQVSTQALHVLAEQEIPVLYLSTGNWFYGTTVGMGLRNAFVKHAQFQCADDPHVSLRFAKAFVQAKCRNQRTMLVRNGSKDLARNRSMKNLIETIDSVIAPGQLLGTEGAVASAYFGSFDTMIKVLDAANPFSWESRNRRPPKDPVNALLSFGYALLAKDCTVALLGVGLDPFWGFFHQPRHGRPALALDLMEEFRPLVVDSAVITAINTGMVKTKDFVFSAGACTLNESGRKSFIRAYESRMDQLVTHPRFDYRLSWRRVVKTQAQLLAKAIRGEISEYTGMVTR